MAGLKSFLNGIAPILGVSALALYERQRALVNLGILEAAPGRGPGSGVPLNPYNVAAIVISILATDNLSDADERVVRLINARPHSKGRDEWEKARRTTFCSSVGAVLSGEKLPWPLDYPVNEIRVVRPWSGILSDGLHGITGGGRQTEYVFQSRHKPSDSFLNRLEISTGRIEISAALNTVVLNELKTFTQGALTQAKAEEDEE